MAATFDPRFADLAETVLALAREIRIHEYAANTSAALASPNAGVMRHVEAHPGATPSETAEATGMLRSNLSTVLRDLERSGLIEKRKDPADGRGVRLHLTTKAEETRRQIRQEWANVFEHTLGTADGVTQAKDLLERLVIDLVVQRQHREAPASRSALGVPAIAH